MTKRAKLKPETIEKLEWLKGRLRKYPHRYDQRHWCGTQACLAGFCYPRMIGRTVVTLSTRVYARLGEDLSIATWADWLGISVSSASSLFGSYWWGKAFEFNRLDTDTDEQAAEKACQRIDLFIESGGTK